MARAGVAVVDVVPDFKALDKMIAARVGPLTSKSGKLGRAMGVGITGGLAAAGGASVALYRIGQQFDDATDKIRVNTGKTGKQLKRLEKDFQAVAKRTPADFDKVSTAIAGLNQRLDITGKPLRRLSRQMLELSRITGTDIQENVPALTRLFGDWSVKTNDQARTLNKLFRASQATGTNISELSRLMVQFGSPLRNLGIGFDQAAAMFSKFEKEGVNIQTTMPGLRMALKNFAKDGKEPAKALAETFEAMRKAGDGAKLNQIAFETFGVRAGADLAAAVREGRFDLDKLMKTISGGRDTIGKAAKDTEDFDEKWQKFKNRTLIALAPTAKKVFDQVGESAEDLFKIIEDPKLSTDEKIEKITDKMADAFEKAAPKIADRAAEIAPRVAKAFVNAFVNAGIWGQLLTVAFLATKLGAFKKMGEMAAKKFGPPFAAYVGAQMIAAQTGAGLIAQALVGKSAKWGKLGGKAGKAFGVAFALAAIFFFRKDIEDAARSIMDNVKNDRTPLGTPVTDIMGSNPGDAGRGPNWRTGGVIQRLRAGGFAQAMVSPGELLAFPGGGAAVVPGPRTAADSVHATLPVGTAVFTGHGQNLLASGASPAQALRSQLPHFAKGGTLTAGQMAGLAAWAGIPKGHQTRMGAIGFRESRGNASARNYNPPIEDSRGLWQINVLAHKWARNWNLYNPETNAKAMRQVYSRAQAAWGDALNPWKPVSTSDPYLGAAGRIVPWGDRAEGGGGGGWPHKVSSWGRSRMQRGILGSAFSDAFEAGREGRGIRGIRSDIFKAVREAVPERRKASGFDPSMPSSGKGSAKPGGGWGGTEAIVKAAVRGFAVSNYKRTPAQNAAAGGSPTSDHLTTMRNAFAADFNAGDGPFNTVKNRLGISATPGSYARYSIPGAPGYGAQLLWKVAGHYDHNHLGVRKMQRGGVLGQQNIAGSYATTLTGVGTYSSQKARQVLNEYSQVIDELAVRQLVGQVQMWRARIRQMFKGGVTRHEAAAVARMRGAISLLRAEAGQRAGQLAGQADRLGVLQERRGTQWEQFMRTAGYDPSSSRGLQVTRLSLRDQEDYQRRQRANLRRALAIARKAGDAATAKGIKDEVMALDQAIGETILQRLENARERIKAKAQEKVDKRQFGVDVAAQMFSGLGTSQALAGTLNTDAGRLGQADFLRTVTVPALTQLASSLANQFKKATDAGEKRSIWLELLGTYEQIGQAQLQALGLIEDNTKAAADRLAAAVDTTSGMFTNLSLTQQLAGTFDTPAGRKARAQYITGTIVPALKAQITGPGGILEQWATARKTPGTDDDVAVWQAWIGVENQILQAQLDAKQLLEVVADNTGRLQELLDLQKAETADWRARFNVSQAQYPVFRDFRRGGMVGPVGGYAAGGTVSQNSTAPVQVQVVVEDGAVDSGKIRVVARDEAVQVTRQQARRGSRGLARAGVL